MRVITFTPPMCGLDKEFNTFRIGIAWSKRLTVGETVLLIDGKQFLTIGYAEVIAIHVGKLSDMSALHALHNHNQLELDPDGAGERLVANMIRRYGPNKLTLNSKVTAIYLKRESYEHRDIA